MRRAASVCARVGGRALAARPAVMAVRSMQQPLAMPALSAARVEFSAAMRSGVRAFSASTFLPEAEVQERVIEVVKNFDKVDGAKVNPQAHFINDLGLDSLDAVELVMAIEEEFVIEIPDDVAEKILTCEDAVKFVSQHPQAQ
uniref:Acyl carrier protein n=1 Tax=Schizochytrium sp. FJU-512 TaxID=297167 RepID=A7Y7F1_9STRA|nr:acyl carrier protein [Schizochytrium sp. FJU-512]|mmetsp:Transcript_6433/g.13053  ORF Transcript_6433/g.13053 Transcript_6433/m.13053 type:complete len:143 (-) Transcript_6433:712-1140(-)